MKRYEALETLFSKVDLSIAQKVLARAKDQYVRKMKWKMAQYHSQAVKFISIYPHDLDTFIYTFPRKFEEVTGKKLPN